MTAGARALAPRGPYEVIETRDREHWAEVRKQRLGASDVPSVCGIGKWADPNETMLRKLGLLPPKEDTKGKMALGHIMQPVIEQLYAKQRGVVAVEFEQLCWSTEWPWLACTPDSVQLFPGGYVSFVQIKNTAIDPRWLEPAGTKIPQKKLEERYLEITRGLLKGPKEEHVYQCEAEMMVTGQSWTTLVYFYGTTPCVWYDLPSNPEIRRHIVKACTAWWARFLAKRGIK